MTEKNQALKYVLIGVGITVALGVCGVGSCVALVGGGAFFAYQALDAPAQVAKQFLEDLKQRRFDQALERTSKQFRAAHPMDGFRVLVEKYPALLENHEEATLPSRQVINDRARIGGMFNHASSQVGVEFELIEEGGAWRIDRFSVAGQDIE